MASFGIMTVCPRGSMTVRYESPISVTDHSCVPMRTQSHITSGLLMMILIAPNILVILFCAASAIASPQIPAPARRLVVSYPKLISNTNNPIVHINTMRNLEKNLIIVPFGFLSSSISCVLTESHIRKNEVTAYVANTILLVRTAPESHDDSMSPRMTKRLTIRLAKKEKRK